MAEETPDTRRKVEEKHANAANLGGMGRSTDMQEVQREIAALLSEQPLAEPPSLSEDMCGGDRVVANDLYSIITFELFYSL